MVALRLVRLIESHSGELAAEIINRLRVSPHTTGMSKVPADELHKRTYEILHDLGEWLMARSETDIQASYIAIGARRQAQGVPLADFCWAITLTKEHIWSFLQRQGFLLNSVELYGQLELLSRLDQFFEHALCYAAEGYGRHQPLTQAVARRASVAS